MCCRYVFDGWREEKYQDELDKLIKDAIASVKVGEICPTDKAPVIASSAKLNIRAFGMKWGYASGKSLVFNARSETAAAKPMFKESLELRRCLVPANLYYEWQKSTRAKYAISSDHMIYMAGLYRLEADGPHFTILTRDSSPELAFIHPRMPLILPPSCLDQWLDRSQDPAALLGMGLGDLTYRTA
jgi:putative SOS response-associated peptidase YedK